MQKIRRLRRRDLLRCPVLFAVAAPPADESKRFNAYQEVCGELQSTEVGVQVVQREDESAIVDFAKK